MDKSEEPSLLPGENEGESSKQESQRHTSEQIFSSTQYYQDQQEKEIMAGDQDSAKKHNSEKQRATQETFEQVNTDNNRKRKYDDQEDLGKSGQNKMAKGLASCVVSDSIMIADKNLQELIRPLNVEQVLKEIYNEWPYEKGGLESDYFLEDDHSTDGDALHPDENRSQKKHPTWVLALEDYIRCIKKEAESRIQIYRQKEKILRSLERYYYVEFLENVKNNIRHGGNRHLMELGGSLVGLRRTVAAVQGLNVLSFYAVNDILQRIDNSIENIISAVAYTRLSWMPESLSMTVAHVKSLQMMEIRQQQAKMWEMVEQLKRKKME